MRKAGWRWAAIPIFTFALTMKSIYARERTPFLSRAQTFFITMKNLRRGNEVAHRAAGRKTFSIVRGYTMRAADSQKRKP